MHIKLIRQIPQLFLGMSQYLCNLIHDKPCDNQISNMKKIRTAAAKKSKETAEDDKDLVFH